MTPPVIRVMIVDDHPRVRQALTVFVEVMDDFLLVGQADNGEQAIPLVASVEPHVVLMDLMMPVMDGVTATRIIRQKYPDLGIIVLTSTVELDVIHEAIEAGANTYMLKNVSIDTMAQIIRSVVHKPKD
jgi:NarL family two-component system response regulator LiaR